jgi:hypothetical protein
MKKYELPAPAKRLALSGVAPSEPASADDQRTDPLETLKGALEEPRNSSRASLHFAAALTLVHAVAAARERGDERSFADAIVLALALNIWSPAELSDRFDAQESIVTSWRSPSCAPQAAMREFVLEELQAALMEGFEIGPANMRAKHFANADSLLDVAKIELLTSVRTRLSQRGGLDESGWLTELVRLVGWLQPAALSEAAATLNCSDVKARAWGVGADLPKGRDEREAFVQALQAALIAPCAETCDC